jgi:hypothetical protein
VKAGTLSRICLSKLESLKEASTLAHCLSSESSSVSAGADQHSANLNQVSCSQSRIYLPQLVAS